MYTDSQDLFEMRTAWLLVCLFFGTAAALAQPVVSALTLETNPSVGGNNIVARVSLDRIAPVGGQPVSVSSSDLVPDLPSTVVVPHGRLSWRFSFTPAGVDATKVIQLNATVGAVTQSADLTVNPARLSRFYFEPDAVVGGRKTTGVVNLTGAC